MVAVCRAVRLSGPPGIPDGAAEAPSLRFGGFEPTGPRATRVSAPGTDGFRPRSAHIPTRARTAHRSRTRGSPVRRIRVARRGTQIIYVRRILLGHSLPSPAGNTAPPPARNHRNIESSSVR
ncbi:hypothetical protein GCM10010508_67660 [Streptomyces naganishii JCM 4654]|uniref:Uncharacterized protein n=1 Tax=Streptomyces naganishii JCM 4654 TaxID=1306179 RepID=A0A919CYZ3_9ACTN|nr:hypothetical protein GCM10010508_67660 [Streptomyces naganishii JCM 4654]